MQWRRILKQLTAPQSRIDNQLGELVPFRQESLNVSGRISEDFLEKKN